MLIVKALISAGKNIARASVFVPAVFLLFFSCSFDYGETEDETSGQPDIVMENVDYVRFRGGDPQVRFQAELAERYEEKQTMNLKRFTFEQFQKSGGEVDTRGSAGEAQVELESGNIRLEDGVTISIDSEDIIIKTTDLNWQDKDKLLSGSPDGSVDIERSDGTSFSGSGFSANVRSRTWNFDKGVSGLYFDNNEDEGGAEETEAAQAAENPAPARDF